MSRYNARELNVREVIGTSFVFEIPNYQRGYCWSETEVCDLLDDSQDAASSEGRPYCIQPVSFDTEKEEAGVVIVVDGQQRLTNLLLIILKFIEEKLRKVPVNVLLMIGIDDPEKYYGCFSLFYEDRFFITLAVISILFCLKLGAMRDKEMAYRFISVSNSFLAKLTGNRRFKLLEEKF